MKKRIFPWIFTAGVLLMSIVLVVGILFAGPAQAGANEVLSKAPQLKTKDGKFNDNFFGDTAAWINDHFFGRQELISVHNKTVSTAFGTSAADDVILGSDGWLYYTSTLNDYTGLEAMDTADIQMAAHNLELLQEYCHSQGREFAFVLAPNKNSLYPEYMPNYGIHNPSTNAKQLMEELDSRGVAYIDLFDVFSQQEEVLYFAHDSHWNSKGAALGADSINAAFGVQSDYFGGDFSQKVPHAGDLYEMLYPSLTDPEQDALYGGSLNFTYTSKATKPDSITLETASDNQGSLLCYRDSFGNLLYPYLADSYGTCRFSRSVSYDLTQDGDCVLIELVERNISYLCTNLPVMPAPERTLPGLPKAADTTVIENKSVKAPEGMFRVSGTLPEPADPDSPVYVICGNTAYEAFQLLDGGFGAYTPTEAEGIAFYTGGILHYYYNAN